MATVGDQLFVAGGAGGDGDEDETWRSVECFEPALGKWRPVAPMSKARSFFGMAALDGKIYAAGGCDGGSTDVFKDAEVYDPATDCWSPIANLW